jgi:hypothetical protein
MNMCTKLVIKPTRKIPVGRPWDRWENNIHLEKEVGWESKWNGPMVGSCEYRNELGFCKM